MSQGSAEIIATPSQSAEDFKAGELNVEVETSLARIRENGFKYVDNYGFRKLGDPLIDYRRGSKKWSSPQDIELIVACQAPPGQHIASADVTVEQSSHNHESFILDGGIGEKNIRIVIKVRNAYWLKYESRVYGEQWGEEDDE